MNIVVKVFDDHIIYPNEIDKQLRVGTRVVGRRIYYEKYSLPPITVYGGKDSYHALVEVPLKLPTNDGKLRLFLDYKNKEMDEAGFDKAYKLLKANYLDWIGRYIQLSKDVKKVRKYE